ncbi:MAG TPA: YceI family protein [Rickettsiales bacterium]|nr:YceI family protein [Rickettsiales bacterium]
MRHLLSRLTYGTLLACTLATPSFASPETYTLDPMHTAVEFHINHFGFSNPSGKFMNIQGTLVLDQQNPAASKVNVTIPIANLDTDIAKLDEHVKGKEFLDAEAFPTATYVSDRVDLNGKDSAVVHGTLTLHGVSKPVALNVKLNKLDKNMMNKMTAGFTASTSINRSDFGIDRYLPGLGDQVKIDIESEANLQ